MPINRLFAGVIFGIVASMVIHDMRTKQERFKNWRELLATIAAVILLFG